ncbi:T9SS type A sorting domain-containing protein [Lentimicrobium sp. S6]|uniref:T9SS type A sorting domain-containing protein n=1 Tax=Lentimicrobium sp. S6 TaxID=2735872 RepID=UPI001551B8F3|nr:T9SS type A sorting domain-containing protein [Lentimicrobium sp. S6]NPD44197.1 T9SS type A sorting domain-containing protein [Lentimicrobium sp. S6]
MRTIFLFSFFLILTVSIRASIIQVSGNVSGTWNADTVQVIDDILIPNNQILTINPGVKVIFDGYYFFNISGQIQANGLANDSISFFVSDTTGLYNLETNEGSWAGFWFEQISPNNDSSTFEFCKFNYGKAVSTDSVYWYGGAVRINKSDRIRFSNCSFSNNIAYKNGGAIYCRDSDIKIEHCMFLDNAGGTSIEWGYGGAVCLEYSNAIVCRNYFAKNSSTGTGGGLSFEYSDPDIEANIFYNNFSAIGGGLCCIRSKAGKAVVNNLFDHNGSTFFGGALAFLEAHTLFTNNTVVNNSSIYGGGFHINAGANPIIKNCIIWNNTISSEEGPQVCMYDVYSAPEFYYNNIEGGFEDFTGSGVGNGLIIYDNNIDLDPQFVGTGDFPFSPHGDSPCVNTGTPDTTGLLLPHTDLAGQLRIQEDQIDMGCYENQGNSGIQSGTINKLELSVSPNPITDHSIINLNILEQTELEFTITDSQGKEIVRIPMQDYSQGKHQISLPIIKLNSGLYFLKALEKNSNRIKVSKLMAH